MLKPAILYKEEIIKGLQEYFYTDDMMYETGCLDNWCPDISEMPDEGTFQFAIVHRVFILWMDRSYVMCNRHPYDNNLFYYTIFNLIVKLLYINLEARNDKCK